MMGPGAAGQPTARWGKVESDGKHFTYSQMFSFNFKCRLFARIFSLSYIQLETSI